MPPSVLIIGASGALGRPLVEEFKKQRSRFERVAVLADPTRAHKFDEIQKEGIEVVVGSYLDFKCYQGFDVVLSLVGNALMRLQPAMIEAAVAGGVKHFYPSEFGTDISQPEGVRQSRYLRDKVVTRDHLAATARVHPEFRYTLVLVGQFSEWAIGPFAGVDTEKHVVEAYGFPEAWTSATAIPDVARYTVDSIFMPFPPNQSSCREIRVRGDHLPWTQLIALLEEMQGVKYQVTFIDPKVAAAKQEEARVRGDEEDELRWAGRVLPPSGMVQIPEPLDNDKFGFRPQTMREVMQRMFAQGGS